MRCHVCDPGVCVGFVVRAKSIVVLCPCRLVGTRRKTCDGATHANFFWSPGGAHPHRSPSPPGAPPSRSPPSQEPLPPRSHRGGLGMLCPPEEGVWRCSTPQRRASGHTPATLSSRPQDGEGANNPSRNPSSVSVLKLLGSPPPHTSTEDTRDTP